MVRRSEVLKNAFERVGMLSRRHEDSLKESVDEFDAVVMKFSLEHDMALYSSHIQLPSNPISDIQGIQNRLMAESVTSRKTVKDFGQVLQSYSAMYQSYCSGMHRLSRTLISVRGEDGHAD
eukprot:66704_1